ncbi:MAG: hypothetical protein MJ252_01535 [archaeon]|nr:hypothetical protein [archaeon]
MEPKSTKHRGTKGDIDNIKEEKIDEIIVNYLNTPKFQTSLNSLIISTLSNRKNMNLTREGLSEKILMHDYIKDVEKEILSNLFQAFDIENYNTNELINLKYKNLINKGNTSQPKRDEISFKNPQASLLSSLNSQVNSAPNSNIDSNKLLNILTEEFLYCDDNIKLENYIGDLSSFDAEILVTNEKIEQILGKIDVFLKRNGANDMFLIPNLLNFFNKITKFTNTKILCISITVFLDYFGGIVTKFYESTFDITKFYKLSFNVECLNKMVMKFYDNSEIFLRKVEENTLKSIINKIFDCVMKNYSSTNSVYLCDTMKDKSEGASYEFGLSTNYILLLFFLLDNNFSLFKVIFRLTSLRKYIVPKFVESSLIKSLPFLDMVSCFSSLSKKYCFLWSHYSVLEKVFSDQKINKKFLLYCWICIKLNFLGLILRYKSLRNKFYSVIVEVDPNLNCFVHFKNVLGLAIDLVVDSKQEFEEDQKENLFYLAKEILCDFILYCGDKNCCIEKMNLIKRICSEDMIKKEKMVYYLINDLQLAFKDNIYTHDLQVEHKP